MASMVKEREGYRTLFVQLPEALWEALASEADGKHEGNITRTVMHILQERYKVPASKLPKPRRMGRPRRE